MGYTHYWRKTRPISRDEWSKISDDAHRVIGLPSVAALLDEVEEIAGELINFNGIGENAHETFHLAAAWGDPTDSSASRAPLEGEVDFDFCKTARKPYDAVVTAVLLIAAKHCPALRLSSDGTWPDWAPGVELCAMAGINLGADVVAHLAPMLEGRFPTGDDKPATVKHPRSWLRDPAFW